MPAKGPSLYLSVVLGLLVLLSSAGAAHARVTVKIDRSLARAAPLSPLADGTLRPVGALLLPDGERVSFVENELIVHANPRLRLASLLAAYHGTVVSGDAQLGLQPPVRSGSAQVEAGRWLLIRTGGPSSRGDLESNLRRVGVKGTVQFSSEASARTMALFLREAERSVSLNVRGQLTAISEHPSSVTPSGTTYLDASTWGWMTDDDNAMAPGSQGLSIGVTRAWDYMAYKGVQSGTVVNRPFVAIVDGGFDLDASGAPASGNLDYDNTSAPPRQLDVVDHDGKAGGKNLLACSGGGSCPWHGTGSFGAAAAYPRNRYGSAGSGGGFSRPLLVRISVDAFTIADGVRSAALNGAAVISLSLSFGCGPGVRHFVCSLPPDDIYDMIYQSVALARSQRSIVLAAAGNEGDDVGGKDVYPCRTSGVICVGAVRMDKQNAYNYGAPVDISGPACLRSTVDPGSAGLDNDGIGLDELRNFCGTSAATPFVAGIVGLMKAANPSLSTQPVLDALQSTANSSPDPRVPRGYVDAFRAVEHVLPNARPRVTAVTPSSGTLVGWQRQPRLSVAYTDPETSTIEAANRWRGRVSFGSDRNGLLCVATTPPYACNSMPDALELGRHRIRVRATDAFGSARVVRTTIRVVNRRPSVTIGSPAVGVPLYSHLPTQLRAHVTDRDENVSGITVRWRSSRDGFLGTGQQLNKLLSAGHHILTAEAVDGKGASASAARGVDVRSGTGLPSPKITAPTQTHFSPGEEVTLHGNATDPEDGQLTGAALRWSSDLDGFLGIGNVLTVTLSGPATPCHPEFRRHTVTLRARDGAGNEVPAEKRISIGAVC